RATFTPQRSALAVRYLVAESSVAFQYLLSDQTSEKQTSGSHRLTSTSGVLMYGPGIIICRGFPASKIFSNVKVCTSSGNLKLDPWVINMAVQRQLRPIWIRVDDAGSLERI